jgi:hypothetical protein
MTSYINKLKDFDKQILFEFKEKTIITDLYQYYFYNGFYNIYTEKIIRLLISYLLIFIINLVINCIDYKALITLSNNYDTSISHTNQSNLSSNQSTHQSPPQYIQLHKETKSIYDYINLSNWFPTNPYLIICFILYCIYLFCITINCIGTIKKFWKIRKIYNRYLNINDYRLKFITWDEIVSQITERLKPHDILDTTNINIYTINNKICNQSNIIIALLRSNLISLPKLSKFLEWNFIFCIIDPMTKHIKPTSSTSSTSDTSDTSDTPLNQYINQSSNNQSQILTELLTNQNNKNIYQKYKEPLLANTLNEIEHPYTTNYNLENISLSSASSPSSTPNPASIPNSISPYQSTSQSTSQNTHSESIAIKMNLKENDKYVTNSLIKENKFDNVLYNTFINQSVCNTEIAQFTEYIKTVNYRINLALAINIIAMPFTILILLVYLIIKYGEKMYINPSILFQRQINIKTRWKLRYYNELPNLFKDRLFRIERNMDKIINSYHSVTREIIYRFLIFTIGSIFIILLAISFVATEAFSELEIINGHNIIWFLGISGTFLIILNKCVANSDAKLTRNEQIKAFEELREDLVSINPKILKTEDREYLVNLIKNIYQSRMTHIFYEIWYLFTSPYYLWKWKADVGLNCNKILELIENHYTLGNVCKYSIFTNVEEIQRNPHMLLSLKEFYNNHNWNLPNVINCDLHNIQNSILLQSKIFN